MVKFLNLIKLKIGFEESINMIFLIIFWCYGAYVMYGLAYSSMSIVVIWPLLTYMFSLVFLKNYEKYLLMMVSCFGVILFYTFGFYEPMVDLVEINHMLGRELVVNTLEVRSQNIAPYVNAVTPEMKALLLNPVLSEEQFNCVFDMVYKDCVGILEGRSQIMVSYYSVLGVIFAIQMWSLLSKLM